ncbi:hypothetical protein C7M84_016064 [Penaeus vannamei]|uniref:Uncharacterized protein n=1 Tax=Penaeus vannamei TaxID=6689 RepID=A0A3R7LXN6_PENVA|nr:hypothetical protein C7M84_016064 [Penaeus vannamei]
MVHTEGQAVPCHCQRALLSPVCRLPFFSLALSTNLSPNRHLSLYMSVSTHVVLMAPSYLVEATNPNPWPASSPFPRGTRIPLAIHPLPLARLIPLPPCTRIPLAIHPLPLPASSPSPWHHPHPAGHSSLPLGPPHPSSPVAPASRWPFIPPLGPPHPSSPVAPASRWPHPLPGPPHPPSPVAPASRWPFIPSPWPPHPSSPWHPQSPDSFPSLGPPHPSPRGTRIPLAIHPLPLARLIPLPPWHPHPAGHSSPPLGPPHPSSPVATRIPLAIACPSPWPAHSLFLRRGIPASRLGHLIPLLGPASSPFRRGTRMTAAAHSFPSPMARSVRFRPVATRIPRGPFIPRQPGPPHSLFPPRGTRIPLGHSSPSPVGRLIHLPTGARRIRAGAFSSSLAASFPLPHAWHTRMPAGAISYPSPLAPHYPLPPWHPPSRWP